MSEPNLNVTYPALYVRNASDVLVVLEAVRRGILPLITLRLSGSERDQLRSGNVFVWEEFTENSGLVRWTDGQRWSQSKVYAECLFYQEKIEVTGREGGQSDETCAENLKSRSQCIASPYTAIPEFIGIQRSAGSLKSNGSIFDGIRFLCDEFAGYTPRGKVLSSTYLS
ncbi:Gti1/Pac2 family-domain-containing protein [Mycena leptocephala]|nr:Gti1/Pac2 family-domain-containing protein [Mycena leptocephala]